MSLGFVSRSRLTSTFSPSSDEKTIPCSDSIDQITFKGLTIPIYISLTFLHMYPLLGCTFFVVLYSLDRWVSSSFKITKNPSGVRARHCESIISKHTRSLHIISHHAFKYQWIGFFKQMNRDACWSNSLTHSLTVKTLRKEDFVCFLWNFIKYYISLQISHGGSDSVSWKSVHKAVQMIRLQTFLILFLGLK